MVHPLLLPVLQLVGTCLYLLLNRTRSKNQRIDDILVRQWTRLGRQLDWCSHD